MQCRMALWSQTQLLRHMWCCGCCCCAAHGVTGAVIRLHYVMVAVAMPRAVSRSQSPCHVQCHSHSRHAMCGVMVTVVAPCGAIIAVTPRVVSQSRSLCHVLQLLSPHRVWCCRHCHWVALCCGHVRCHSCCCRAVWYCHHGHTTCDITVTVITPCGVKVIVAVVVPLVPQLWSSSWWHCHRSRCLHHGRPWRGRMVTHLSARIVVKAQ
jgi:hypothetical protein